MGPANSNQVDEPAEPCNRLGQSVVLQGSKEFFQRPGRMAKALALPLDGGADHAGRFVEKVNQNVIRVLGLGEGFASFRV
jgi:hypothetical protein